MADKKKRNVPTVEETDRKLSEPVRTGPVGTGERYQMPYARRVEEAEVESKEAAPEKLEPKEEPAEPKQSAPARKPAPKK